MAVLQFLEILGDADLGLFGISTYISEVLRLLSLFMGFDGCANVFESRWLGLCEKLGVRFHWGRCGT